MYRSANILWLLALACEQKPVVVPEPLGPDIDLRIFVTPTDRGLEARTLVRREPFSAPWLDVEGKDLWVLGYRREDLPWPAMRTRTPEDIAELLNANFSAGELAPPAPAVLALGTDLKTSSPSYLVETWREFEAGLMSHATGPLRFDPPDSAICPQGTKLDCFADDQPHCWLPGTLGDSCQIGFNLETNAVWDTVCVNGPQLIRPKTGELELLDGEVCTPVAAPRGADLSFQCPAGACREGPRTIHFAVHRDWALKHLEDGWIFGDGGAPIDGQAVSLGQGALYVGRANGELHFARVSVALPRRRSVFTPLGNAIKANAMGRIEAITIDAALDRFVVTGTIGAITGRLRADTIEDARAIRIDEPHGEVAISRHEGRIYAAVGDGLAVFDATTLQPIGRTPPGKADPRVELRRLTLIDTPAGERIVSCEHRVYPDPNFDREIAYRCESAGVYVFDPSGQRLATLDGIALPNSFFLAALDGPRFIFQTYYTPVTTLEPGPYAKLFVFEGSTPGRPPIEYEVPSWLGCGQGAVGLSRAISIDVAGRETWAFMMGDPTNMIDVETGKRGNSLPPFVRSHPLALFHGSDGSAWTLLGSYPGANPPAKDFGLYLAEIPPFPTD